jgi:hypothetical protein
MVYTVNVTTKEMDSFTEVSSIVPTRDQIIEAIRTSSGSAQSNTRLVAIVRAVMRWPTKIVSKKIETVRVGGTVLGRVIFNSRRI